MVTPWQVIQLIIFSYLKWRKIKCGPFLDLGIFQRAMTEILLTLLSWWPMYSNTDGGGTDLNRNVSSAIVYIDVCSLIWRVPIGPTGDVVINTAA